MIKPKEDRVLVLPDEPITQTQSGLILAGTAVQKPITGKVIRVGDGKYTPNGVHIPVRLNEGDHVLYHKQAGTQIETDGNTYLIMNERDVLGVMETTLN